MPQTLRYGIDSTIEIDLPDDVLVANYSSPRAKPIDDLAAAVAAAVDDPLDFPALAQATIAGDRIAIVLEPGLPQVASIVAGAVHSLTLNGVNPSDIVIVCANHASSDDWQDPTVLLPLDVRDAIRLAHHNASDARELAYLAAARNGEPIYLNRNICDADVVIPIGTFRLDPQLNHTGVHASMIRWFSNAATARRMSDQPADGAGHTSRQLRDETDEAAWLLGIQFTVQVIPGPGDSVLHVLAGDANSVSARGRTLCESAWRFDVPRRASLVVATIDGNQTQQTWENFSRALTVASRAVIDDGAIVICTDLRSCPTAALVAASEANSNDDESVDAEDESDSAFENPLAAVLSEARQRSRVYLLSGLDSQVVEDLGLGYVEAAEDIARLSTQHDSCILVAGAQHAVLVTQDDGSDGR